MEKYPELQEAIDTKLDCIRGDFYLPTSDRPDLHQVELEIRLLLLKHYYICSVEVAHSCVSYRARGRI